MAKVEIEEVNGVLVVSTWDFYKFLALSPYNYYKWIKGQVLEKAIEGVDYFNLENPNAWEKKKRSRVRLHITLDYAIGLTLSQSTYLAKTIRKELLKIKKEGIGR